MASALSFDDMVACPGIQQGLSKICIMDAIYNQELLPIVNTIMHCDLDDVIMETIYSEAANL
jgi:hypothetical protein